MTLAKPRLTPTRIDPRAREEMQEAIREIRILAGLDAKKPSPGEPRKATTIGVTSPRYGDGKSTVAIGLASSLGHDFGESVLLVDADLQTQSIARQYQIEEGPGLSEVLMGDATLDDAVYPLEGSVINIVPAGKPKVDPARVARSERVGPILDEVRQRASFVVLDLPAVLHSMNAPALAQRCDGIVVVLRHGKTTREQLDHTLELLRDANVIGLVINRHHTSIPGWVRRSLGLRR